MKRFGVVVVKSRNKGKGLHTCVIRTIITKT
jgi:hypothetical protein